MRMNPVSRILQLASTSELAFRRTYGFSKQFMVDVTAGTYTQLSDRLHETLKDLVTKKGVDVRGLLRDEYQTDTLDAAYLDWQREQRIEVRDKFLAVKPEPGTVELPPAHFFVKYTSGSPTTFSKELKVPPQTVRRWVSGQIKNGQMPEAIADALIEISYPYLDALDRMQRVWTEARR